MWFDLAGAFASLLSTYYFIRLNNKAWPISIVATCLNGFLYWHKGIYANTFLEFCYFLSTCYGWYQWRRILEHNSLTQSRFSYLRPSQWLILSLVTGLLFTFIYYLLSNFAHSTVVLMDATTTSLSLTAQWLMCYKNKATWILWFITDALFAIMYFSKNLPFHSLLMIVYTVLAIIGYWHWTDLDKKAFELTNKPIESM